MGRRNDTLGAKSIRRFSVVPYNFYIKCIETKQIVYTVNNMEKSLMKNTLR